MNYKTGGPSAQENLYTPGILSQLFADWEIEELVEYEDVIEEDIGHRGHSALIVISGYLITSIILAEKQAGRFSLVGFYERRARRPKNIQTPPSR